MDMCLPQFDIYHKLKQTQTLDVLIFSKKVFSDVRCEFTLSDVTSFLLGSLSGLKKIIFRPVNLCMYEFISIAKKSLKFIILFNQIP